MKKELRGMYLRIGSSATYDTNRRPQ